MLVARAPPPDLTDVVEAGVALRRDGGPSVTCFPAMPRAMLTLQLAPALPHGPVQFHALSTRPARHAADGPFHAVGLVLLPAAAAQLLGPRVGALADATLPWAELAGPAEAARLHAVLHGCADDAARLRALHESVRRVLAQGPARVQRARADALQQLVQLVGRHGPQAAAPLALGERQLERRCRALLGVGPKRLQRLVRFQGVLRQLVERRAAPDAGAALAAGYYDQSHLAREAQLLAGAPLRQLLAGAHADGAWWPLASGRAALQRSGEPLRHHR